MGDKSLVTSRVGASDDKSAPWSSANGDIMHLFVPLPYKSSLLRYIVFNLSRDRMFKEL